MQKLVGELSRIRGTHISGVAVACVGSFFVVACGDGFWQVIYLNQARHTLHCAVIPKVAGWARKVRK